MKSKKILFRLVSIMMIIILTMSLAACGNSVDFKKVYDESLEQAKADYTGEEWKDSNFTALCKLSDDGSYIQISVIYRGSSTESDTERAINELFFETDLKSALNYADIVFDKLGLEDSAYQEMVNSISSQSSSSLEENGVSVKWDVQISSKSSMYIMFKKA